LLPDPVSRWTLLLGLLGALPLVLLTPPLQVADEPQHLARAYQISRLEPFAQVQGDGAGAVLPVSLTEMVREQLGTTAIDADRPVTDRPLRKSLAGIGRPLDPDQVAFTDFTGAAPYSPLPYLPQAVAIAAGRLAGLGPLALLYAARLANALAAILLLTLAVRIAPVAREGVAFAGLMPMALYQYASASPDAMTIATALLFTALSMRAVVQGWSGRGSVAAALLGAVFCSHKLVYAPLLLVGLVPGARSRWRGVAIGGAVALAVLAVAIGWLMLNRHLALTRLPGTDVHAQAAFLIGRPGAFPAILWASLDRYATPYYCGLVGAIGWLAMPLPSSAYLFAAVGAILTLFVRRPGEPVPARRIGLWWLLLVAGGIALVCLALYLTWNVVGSPEILGVQGRYFLPLLPLFLVACHTLIRLPADAERARLFGRLVPVVVLMQIFALDAAIVTGYSVL
jgi:uncharacterized membrane protein